jgi:hypothetical protein
VAAAKHDLVIEQGATFRLQLLWEDPNGLPIQIPGHVARMQIRHATYDAQPILSLTSAPGGGITLTNPGQILIEATALQTAALSVSRGVYDVETESPTGVVTRLIEGRVAIHQEVTR